MSLQLLMLEDYTMAMHQMSSVSKYMFKPSESAQLLTLQSVNKR